MSRILTQVLGVPQAQKALSELTRSAQNLGTRIALNAAMGVLKNHTVPPRDTGLLDRSQRVKVKVPAASRDLRHHDKPAYGLLGAGRGLAAVRNKRGNLRIISSRRKSFIQATKALTGARLVFASRYSHFAEKKHRYLTKAVSAGGRDAQEKFGSKMGEFIRQQAAKLASKP